MGLPETHVPWFDSHSGVKAKKDKRPVWGMIGLAIFITMVAGIALGKLLGFRFLISIPHSGKWVDSIEDVSVPMALDSARAEAKKWQSDAILAYMNSAAIETSGGSEVWKFIFVSPSPSAHGKGYMVEVESGNIRRAAEIPYIGAGGEFPSDAIATDEAVRRVRAIKGYEDAEILGIEAVYGPNGGIWYWGVRTSRGVVTIKAK